MIINYLRSKIFYKSWTFLSIFFFEGGIRNWGELWNRRFLRTRFLVHQVGIPPLFSNEDGNLYTRNICWKALNLKRLNKAASILVFSVEIFLYRTMNTGTHVLVSNVGYHQYCN